MSRKDYIAIAGVLRAERPTDGFDRAWCRVVKAFADMLEREGGLDLNGNRRFRRDRFLEACGCEA